MNGGFVYIYIVTPFITDVGVCIDATKPKPYNLAMCVYTIHNMQKGWPGPAPSNSGHDDHGCG